MAEATPYEHYEAYANGVLIGEGKPPVAKKHLAEATEIRWSNPSTDPTPPAEPEVVTDRFDPPEDLTPVAYPRFTPEDAIAQSGVDTPKDE